MRVSTGGRGLSAATVTTLTGLSFLVKKFNSHAYKKFKHAKLQLLLV